MSQTQRNTLTLFVLVLIGINMRPLLTSIGPLLPQLQQATGMSFTLVSLLTALPVIAMGVLALAGGWINRHISENRSIALSLLAISTGAMLRELAPQSGLLLNSALLGGIGIGVIQAIIPSVIKRVFHRRTPQVMGLWSAALMGGGGPGAAITACAAKRTLAPRAGVVDATGPGCAHWLVTAEQNASRRAGCRIGASRAVGISPPPCVDARPLFRADQWRLRQPDCLVTALLYAAWPQRSV